MASSRPITICAERFVHPSARTLDSSAESAVPIPREVRACSSVVSFEPPGLLLVERLNSLAVSGQYFDTSLFVIARTPRQTIVHTL